MTIESSWHAGAFGWYAEIVIEPVESQRLNAHANHADPRQLVSDLRALGDAAAVLADEIEQGAARIAASYIAPYGPELASADDVIAGRARYADTPGGHADRRARQYPNEMLGWDG